MDDNTDRNPHGYASDAWYQFEAKKGGFKTVQAWAQHRKQSAPKCPFCGTPAGFSMGTGDCNCLEY